MLIGGIGNQVSLIKQELPVNPIVPIITPDDVQYKIDTVSKENYKIIFHHIMDIGKKLYRIAMYEKCLLWYNKGLDFIPESVDCNYNIGVTLHKLNRIDDAMAQFKKVLSIDPTHVKSRVFVGQLQEM